MMMMIIIIIIIIIIISRANLQHVQVFGATSCAGTCLGLYYSFSDSRCANGAV
jgi:hypothetical protein